MNFQKILIAVDDSANSMNAARAGFQLAHLLRSKIAVLYVVNKSKEIVNADVGITPEQSRMALLEQAQGTIRQFIKMFDGIDEVIDFTPEGIPEEEILNIAKEWQADLIVLGTHEKSGIERILWGSIAGYLIKHAVIPVLVTPPGME